MRGSILGLIAGAALAGIVPAGALAVAKAGASEGKPRPPDLADEAAGTYFGGIISDSRGASRSGVTITVKRTGHDTVTVHASNRLPDFTVELTRALQTIQQADGDDVFLLDEAKSPFGLDVTVDGASWSGTKR